MKSSDRVILSGMVFVVTTFFAFFINGFLAMGGADYIYFKLVFAVSTIIAIRLDYKILVKSFSTKKTILIIGVISVIPIILIFGYFTGNSVLSFMIGIMYSLSGNQ